MMPLYAYGLLALSTLVNCYMLDRFMTPERRDRVEGKAWRRGGPPSCGAVIFCILFALSGWQVVTLMALYFVPESFIKACRK